MILGDGLLLLLAQIQELAFGLGQSEKRRLPHVVIGTGSGHVLSRRRQHPLRIEMHCLPTLFQTLVCRSHFVLDVEYTRSYSALRWFSRNIASFTAALSFP